MKRERENDISRIRLHLDLPFSVTVIQCAS